MIPAAAKGFGDGGFDWHLFSYVFAAVIVLTLMNNLVLASATFADYFSPKSGRKWLNERKSALAGIIKTINIKLEDPATKLPPDEIKRILTELLDLMVLHIRDYRGSHSDKNRDVFASLLIEDGNDLVIVARDSLAHSTEYERPIPVRYPKASMLCGRAMVAQKVLSVGRLIDEYPEAPKNKPYQSILAIPLFNTKDQIYGAVSIDCSKPYYFQSFKPGVAEDAMENSLQPYLQLVTMTLECFAGRSTDALKGQFFLSPNGAGRKERYDKRNRNGTYRIRRVFTREAITSITVCERRDFQRGAR
jgi:hypothetical protein